MTLEAGVSGGSGQREMDEVLLDLFCIVRR